MIASTLSGGEGLNMQFMNDCIVLERQWNASNEEQAEGRFSRIWNNAWGPKPDFGIVNANYLVAVGTIDEFLAELVEKKRLMFAETMSGESSKERWSQTELFQELADILRSKGGKRFGLS
jgi:SNF2 family DNA or RNA helicase